MKLTDAEIVAEAEEMFSGSKDVATVAAIWRKTRSERLLRALEGRMRLHREGKLGIGGGPRG